LVPRQLIFALLFAAAPVISAAASLDAAVGKRLFERNWVSAPSSTKSDDGLGPLYNATSCVACHAERAVDIDETSVPPGIVVRLGNAKGAGDPVYGRQLQTRAVAGQTPEANPDITWAARGVLRVPAIKLYSQAYGPLAEDTRLALRRAPSPAGIGLLAEVPEREIVERAEANRGKGSGVLGRPAWLTINRKRVLGRFGWKATQPDLSTQISMAFSNDIGLSTEAHPEPWGDCTPAESACRKGPHGAELGAVEVPETLVLMIADYLKSLPPPPPASSSQGKVLFDQVGCSACHATLHLPDSRPVAAYTDLLLHDLGSGLDDGIKEGAAAPNEWRTAPLWNVAASLKVGGLLHDGRARNVAEAIAWHDGEAMAARTRFEHLNASEKAQLVDFVSRL
jgi:CxxC motif-containing protein (DUF1111 family)